MHFLQICTGPERTMFVPRICDLRQSQVLFSTAWSYGLGLRILLYRAVLTS